jgi:hypothetical protein
MTRITPSDKSESRPYAPSWVDHLNDLLDRLPRPGWLYYIAIGLLLFVISVGIIEIEGIRPTGGFLSAQGFLAVNIALFLAMCHYLDDAADAALKVLRPALRASGDEYDELRYQLTTLPSLPTLLVCLLFSIIVVYISETLGTPPSFEQVADSPVSATTTYAMYVLAWLVWGAFIYHTIHQLRVINRTYTEYTRVNLFRIRPLYAFSTVTALTAVSLTIPPYAWLALNQILLDPISIAITLPVAALGLTAFIWPLMGVHRLLLAEKTRAQSEAALRLEAMIAELHRRVDDMDLTKMGALNDAISSLEIERNALKKVPTWPWQPETVRLLVTALALPLGLWLIQYVLQLVLAP